jgi:hypothetical protein
MSNGKYYPTIIEEGLAALVILGSVLFRPILRP